MFEFIDSPAKVPSIIRILLLSFEILITIISFWYIRKKRKYSKGNNLIMALLVILFTFFAISYCTTSDYYSYRYRVQIALVWGSMELVPQTIATLVNGNYDLFRAIIFGSATLCVVICSKIFKANVVLVLLLWFSFFFDRTFYARATLAAAVYFVGIFLASKKNKFYTAFGIMIALSSFYFHRQMIIAIAALPMLFIKVNRKNILPVAFVFFVFAIFIGLYAKNNPSIFVDEEENGIIADKIKGYIESTESGRFDRFTFIGFIQLIFQYFCYYCPVYYISKTILRHQKLMSKSIMKVYNILLCLVAIATVFFVIFGQNNTFFYRTLYLSFIPNSILLVKLYYNRFLSRKTLMKVMIYFLIFHTSFWTASILNLL